MTFGQRLALVRKQRDLTQKDLGVMIGMVADLVSKYEKDRMSPSIEIAAKFAKALNISLDYLVLGHEAQTENTTDAVLYKLQQLEKLTREDKAHVMAVIDAFITKQRVNALLGE